MGEITGEIEVLNMYCPKYGTKLHLLVRQHNFSLGSVHGVMVFIVENWFGDTRQFAFHIAVIPVGKI